MTNYFYFLIFRTQNINNNVKNFISSTDISRLDKSPLLANGYNAPPTHLNHMPFMQMGHHNAPLMNPGMQPHGLPRPDAAAMLKNQNIPGMEAITRQLFFNVDFKLIY